MTDPERLLRNPSSPLSLLVMRAGADEKPSAVARSRTARAAVAAATGAAATGASAVAQAAGAKLAAGNALPGLAGGAAGAGGSAAPTGATLGVGLIAKWLGMGALGGVIAAPLMHAVVPTQGARQAQPLPALTADAPVADRSRRSNLERQAVPEVAGSANPYEREREYTAETRKARLPEPRGDRETAEAPAPTDAAELAAEVRFVDRGRAALERGAFEEALGLLAAYEARFPRQQLLTEVLFLRMEALARSGDAEQARTLAARVITRGIAGPQAARARQVLGR